MSKKTLDGQGDLVPLNSKLFSEFSIEMLEERLETDPLMLSGMFEDIVPFGCPCKGSGGFSCDSYCDNVYCTPMYDDSCNCNAVNLDVESK